MKDSINWICEDGCRLILSLHLYLTCFNTVILVSIWSNRNLGVRVRLGFISNSDNFSWIWVKSINIICIVIPALSFYDHSYQIEHID